MEEHRLKGIDFTEFDPEVYKSIYEQTAALRSSLAYNIDERRFGVEKQDIQSWFNSKFIFIYNKYHAESTPDELKARIINGLQYFKNRILRKAYTKEAEARTSMTDISELYDNPTYSSGEEVSDRELQVAQVKRFMKSKLSSEAYDVFLTQTYPPDYIIEKLKANPKQIHRVPKEVLAEYFDISIKLLDKYLKEIRACIRIARLDLTTL